MKMKCKYEQKANLGEKYIKCGRDGSIRRADPSAPWEQSHSPLLNGTAAVPETRC